MTSTKDEEYYCSECNYSVNSSDAFCKDCGANLSKIVLEDEKNTEIIKSEVTNNSIEWHYELNGIREGPVKKTDIISLFENDILNGESRVWERNFENWLPLRQTELVPYLSNAPPPISGDKVNDTFIWLLAFAPILGALIWGLAVVPNIESILEIGLWSTVYSLEISFYFLINSSLATLDDIKLKNAGYNTFNRFWAIFFIPVYLWRRATITKQSPSFFWIWIIGFLLIFFIQNSDIFFASNNPNSNSYSQPIIQDKYVRLVKNGNFHSYPNHTIDKAVSSFFSNPRWKEITATDGYIYVNMRGGMSYNSTNVNVLLQFSILEDNTFTVNAFEINGIPQNQLMINILLGKMFSSIP